MKKTFFLIVLSIIIQTESLAQSCLPSGIIFWRQTEIDSFQINYPNCNEIEGDVTVFDQNHEINNLNGLEVLTAIGGNLVIGSLLYPNPILTNLSGLDNINSIGGNLEIVNTPFISNLAELSNLTYVGGAIRIENDISLTSLWGLSNITSIGGDLSIQENEMLQNLGGLINLQSINGELVLRFNGLNSIEGIKNIDATSILHLEISFQYYLSICEVKSICDYLSNPNGGSFIYSNYDGCNSKSEIIDACTVSVLKIERGTDFILYPNPATNEVVLKSGKNIEELDIYNLQGQQVLHRESKGSIDVTTLQPGIYIIEVVTEDARVREKLIIQ